MKTMLSKVFQSLRGTWLPAAVLFGFLFSPSLAQSQNTNASAEMLHQQGHQLEKAGNLVQAFQAYREAAEQGATFAMVDVYFCYWKGKGVSADHAKAMDWLKKSADAKNPYGECLMGIRCEDIELVGEGNKRHFTKADWQGALRWYRRSAEQNWAGGQYHLGKLYLEGRAVAVDEVRGLELIRAAADQELEPAMEELADLYARGVGEPRCDQERPVALLERLKKWPELQNRYEYGLGTERDLVAAARCFSKRVLNGWLNYQPYDLAKRIEFTTPPNPPVWAAVIDTADKHVQIRAPSYHFDASDDVLQMLSLYLKSARGDGSSAFRIGNFYQAGINTPKSGSWAWAWLKIADHNGDGRAREKIAGLEPQLTAEEMKIAQQRLAALTADLKEVAAVLR